MSEDRTKRIMEESKIAIENAELAMRRGEEFHEELGLPMDASEKYLNSDKVSPEDRERVKKELDEFLEQVRREADEAAEQGMTSEEDDLALKRNMLRV